MKKMIDLPLGLTFDDVLLIPRRFNGSSRSNIDTSTKFTKKIPLSIPIVSSNMDTVTEANMAITMARAGGIGVIHRFLPIKDQVKEIIKVKRAESVIIENPYTLAPQNIVKDAHELMDTHEISGIIITDSNNLLTGILTKRDLRFLSDEFQEIKEVMTPKESIIFANNNISMDEAKSILSVKKVEKLPLVDDDGVLTGLITSKDIENRQLAPNSTKDDKGRLRVGAAIGVKQDYLERTQALLNAGTDAIVVDIAHGHSNLAINAVKKLRKEFGSEIQIVAGNVATAEGTTDLISSEVDAVKVGVGPGSICITRVVTGSGVPQFTAILNSYSIANDEGVPIISDGGIRTSGDLAKAIAAGASTAMIGNLLAGTSESPGFPFLRNGRQYKIVRGMASLGATLGRESREKKGAFDDDDFSSVVPEGVEAFVPYRGNVQHVLKQLVGGLQSAISYCGSFKIAEMQKNAQFMRITSAGAAESDSHDVDRV